MIPLFRFIERNYLFYKDGKQTSLSKTYEPFRGDRTVSVPIYITDGFEMKLQVREENFRTYEISEKSIIGNNVRDYLHRNGKIKNA